MNLSDRQFLCGGSDVAPILGFGRWRTPLDVWREKVGPEKAQRLGVAPAEERPDTDPMRWGRMLEPALCQEAARQTGLQLGPAIEIAKDWKVAHLDATLAGDPLEAKLDRFGEEWGEPGSDEVAPYYLPQVAWYMAMTGKALAHVAVLIGGTDFRLYRVQRDQRIEAALLQQVWEWWDRHVLRAVPPDPIEGTQDARRRWARSIEGKTLPIDPVLQDVREMTELKQAIKQHEARIDSLQHRILTYAQDAEALVDQHGSPLVTCRQVQVEGRTQHVKPYSFRSIRTTKWWERAQLQSVQPQ